MASEAPSWADTWGTGGIGDRDEVDDHEKAETKKEGVDTKKKSAGFNQIKTVTSNGIKWIKNKCQKKKTSTKEDTS